MAYKPTSGMKSEAQKGLDWRSEYGRGGTDVGIARARDIVNDRELSEDTVKRMYSFFSRHEVDKQAEGFRPGEDGYPSNGRIAWALWGGDAGLSWSRDKVKGMDEDRAYEDFRPYPNEHAARLHYPSKYDSFRRDNDAGGPGVDFIFGILVDGGTELQAIRFDKNRYTVAQAKDWLREHDHEPIMFEEATGEREMADEELEARATVKVEIEIDTSDAPMEEDQPEVSVEDVDAAVEIADALDRKAMPEIVHRSNAMEAKIIDEKTRSVHIAVSSELGVDRSFGKEILDHSEESINLEFLRSGRAPLLLDHDPEKQIGVIESVSLDGDRVLRSKVRFGRSALAQEVFQDVLDGIRGNVSVGYRVNKMERDASDKNAYRVKSWSPMEVSVVSIPADPSVGVGRSAVATESEPKIEPSVKKDTNMSEVNLDAVRAEAAKAASDNAAEIVKLGQRHNKADLAGAAIAAGKSIDQFRGELLEVIGNAPLDNKEIGLSKKEVREFSVVRAIRALTNPTDRAAQEAARFELEASDAAARAYGTTAQGVMIPADVLGNWGKRDLNTSDDNEIVATNLMAGDFIDALRNSSSVMQAGARMMPGLVGNVSIPKKTAASSGGWISSEGGAASESEFTLGSVTMAPKTVGAFSDMTRQLILQSTPSVEALVRDDLTQALALAIDAGALKGSGSSGQPTGLYSTSGINTDSFAGATPTWAEIVGLETLVAEDNALLGNLAYIAPAGLYGTLKTTAKATNQAIFAVDPDGTMNGYRTIVSNQATAGYLLFGNFSDCLIGMWGGLDLTVDPYTASTTGTVRVVALQTVDVAVRHAVSFALGTPAA
jgi:HK97 family phage major capsid protein/HK97 family phage prohead protease